MAAFEAGLANGTPVSKPRFLRLQEAPRPTSLYSGQAHSGLLVVQTLLLSRASSHRLQERKGCSQIGSRVFSFKRSQVLLAKSTWSRLTPWLEQFCGVPHFQESRPARGGGGGAWSRICPRAGSKMQNHATGENFQSVTSAPPSVSTFP